MRQELIDLMQEIESLGNSLTHSFLLGLSHNDMDLDEWERLQDCLKEIYSKSNTASLLAARVRIEEPK